MEIPNLGREELKQKKKVEKLKQEVFSKYLTREARERLGNLKYAHPELADAVENLILQSALSNRLRGVIDDEKLKDLLNSMSEPKRGGKITFERKT